MCTSTGWKPARRNAAAISTWLFTPCSRRIATGGFAPVLMNGAAGFSAGAGAGAGVGFGLGAGAGAGASAGLSLGAGGGAFAGLHTATAPGARYLAPERLLATSAAPAITPGALFDVTGKAVAQHTSAFKANVGANGGLRFDEA